MGRLLTMSMNFMFLILIAAYTANLASFLVAKNSSKIVINEFDDVLNYGEKICVQRGYSYVERIKSKYPGSDSLMIEFGSQAEMYQALQNGDCLVLLTSMEDWKNRQRDAKYNVNCGMHWVGRRVESVPASFAIRTSAYHCTGLLNDVLDFHLIQMSSDGSLQEIWSNYRDATLDSTCEVSTNTECFKSAQQLSVFNMAGIILFHLAILLFTVVVEVCLFCNTSKEKKVSVEKEIKEAATSVKKDIIEGKNRCMKICYPKYPKLVPKNPDVPVDEVKKEEVEICRREVNLHIEKMERRFADE